MSEGKYGHLIVSDLKYEPPMTPEYRKVYEKFSHRQLWIDGNIVPGAFQMNTAWYDDTPTIDPIFAEHQHESEEIIGFFSGDPSTREFDGLIQVIIDGEPHDLTRSSMIFMPAGVPHAIRVLKVTRPIFHFSVVTSKIYNNASYG